MGPNAWRGSFRFSLSISAMLACAAYRWLIAPSATPAELWAGVSFDACVFGGLWALSELCVRTQKRAIERAGEALLYAGITLFVGLVFAHGWFYDASIERRLTLLDVTAGGIYAFFAEVLPPEGLAVMAALALGVALLAFALQKVISHLPPSRGALFAALPVLAVVLIQRAPRVPSPLFDTAQELWQIASAPKLHADPGARARLSLTMLDKSERGPSTLSTPFKKVIVLVMETMTMDKLEKESTALPPSTFLIAERAHLHEHTNYFPNNQDSRTGMLDILGSRLIPYEAYGDEDVRRYRYVSGQPSLVQRFSELGYETASVVSQVELEDVVTDLPWKQQLHLDPAQIAAASRRMICLTPDIYEQSCEDAAMLPQLFSLLDRHERVFVFQEFIWGHAWEYNQASGKTNTAYYSAYVDALLAHLRETGQLDETLIVLTSDHGFRDKGLQHRPEVYRIPLLFYASRFTQRSEARLLSHLDFKDLLFRELGGAAGVDDNPFVMIVGPTGNHFVTTISPKREVMLVKRRWSMNLLLTPAPQLAVTPAQIVDLFERYRADFDARAR